MQMTPNSDFARFEHEGWERVADKYETTWALLTKQYIDPLLALARIKPGMRVLDVACGPGYAAGAVQKLGATPTGIDFSNKMVVYAKKLNPGVEFLEGDAHHLQFPSEDFDRVVMNFGILHLSDPEKACAEAFRVLRRGGRFVFSVWAPPEINPGGRIMNDAVEKHGNLNVVLPQGPSRYPFADLDECRQTLRFIGFTADSITMDTVTVDWIVPTVKFLFECERDAGVRTAGLLALQSPGQLEAIRGAVEKSVESYKTGEGYAIPMAAQMIAAGKD